MSVVSEVDTEPQALRGRGVKWIFGSLVLFILSFGAFFFLEPILHGWANTGGPLVWLISYIFITLCAGQALASAFVFILAVPQAILGKNTLGWFLDHDKSEAPSSDVPGPRAVPPPADLPQPERGLECPNCSHPYQMSDYRPDAEIILCRECKERLPR